MIHAASILAGLGLVAASTWYAIEAASLEGAHMVLVGALAVGVSVGGAVIGRSSWRVGLCIALAVLAGEAYGMVATAERIIRAREKTASPVLSAKTAVADRERQIAAAKADLARYTSEATARAAARDCGDRCKATIDANREVYVRALADARALPVPEAASRSISPLADRLGVQPWALDLAVAGLLTLAANGLGCLLIAWGAHRPNGGDAPPLPAPAVAADAKVASAEPKNIGKSYVNPKTPEKSDTSNYPEIPNSSNVVPMSKGQTLGLFLKERLEPAEGGRVSMKELIEQYRAWCTTRGVDSLPTPQIVDGLGRFVERTGLRTETEGKTVYCVGATLRQHT